jgi:hypothetical protein
MSARKPDGLSPRKQSFGLAVSILADHIGKISEVVCVVASAVPKAIDRQWR